MRIIYLLMFFLFLFSSLYLTDTFNGIGSLVISGIILLMVPSILIMRQIKVKVHLPSLLLMYCFLVICTLAAFYNSDVFLLVDAFIIFATYFVSFIVLPTLKQDNSGTIYKVILISHIPLILIPLINGLPTGAYKGIFYNPNAFGTIVATLFAVVFATLLFKIEQRVIGGVKTKRLLLDILFTVLLLFLTILSASRTSTLTIGLILVAGLCILFVRLIKARKVSAFLKASLIGSLLLFVTYLIIMRTPMYKYFYQNIIYKFQRKSDDMLDGRGDVWTQTINDAQLLGHGSDFFNNTSVAAHNTFISILGEYGWLALIVFILLLINLAYNSFRYAINVNYDAYKYIPINLVICFVTLSMGESMLYKLSMLALFFSAGSIVHYKLVLSPKVKNHKYDRGFTIG